MNAPRSTLAESDIATSTRWAKAALLLACAVMAPARPTGLTAATAGMAIGNRPRPAAGAMVSGRVVTAEPPGHPIAGATVTVTSIEGEWIGAALSDADGAFVVTDLPGERVRISASKPSYLTMEYGARRPGRRGLALPIADARTTDLVLPLPRGGIIAGTVFDEAGQPLPGISFQVLRSEGDRLVPVLPEAASYRERMTDDRGRFRLAGLEPGDYYVGVTAGIMGAGVEGRPVTDEEVRWARRLAGGSLASSDREPPFDAERGGRLVYPSTFHPAAWSLAEATRISIGAGETRADVDIHLRLAAASSLTGQIVDADGAPVSAKLTVFPAGPYVPESIDGVQTARNGEVSSRGGTASLRTAADGRFRITSLTPGAYRLVAWTDRTSMAPAQWASTMIAMADVDREGVVVALSPGGRIAGSVVAAAGSGVGGVPASALASVRFALVAESDSVGAASIRDIGLGPDASEAFAVTGIAPGRYRLQVTGLPPGWIAHSAIARGVDCLDRPIDIDAGSETSIGVVVSPRPASIGGRFTDDAGRPATDYDIVLFPEDRTLWLPSARRVHVVRPDVDGRFDLAPLPAGRYRLAASWDAEPDEWFDPTFLDALSAASIPIALAEGEHLQQDIQVAGGANGPSVGGGTARPGRFLP